MGIARDAVYVRPASCRHRKGTLARFEKICTDTSKTIDEARDLGISVKVSKYNAVFTFAKATLRCLPVTLSLSPRRLASNSA